MASEKESNDKSPTKYSCTDCLVKASLLARTEIFTSENTQLKIQVNEKRYFRIEDIKNDDRMVRFYTGFVSFSVFTSFFLISLGQL